METVQDTLLRERAADALRRIASVRELEGRVYLDLPIMYPSGALAVVDIERNNGKYWVSDCGHGRLEAEFSGADEYYESSAKRIAHDLSVSFDGDSIFALWVDEALLESAIVCVANASNSACADAIRRSAEHQTRRHNDQVFEKIKLVFGQRSVAKTHEMNGRHASWEAHNVVTLGRGQRAIFEPMAAHSNSVSSKFLMFSDLRAAHIDLALNAVVTKLSSLDKKAQMVGDLANIIEYGAPDEVFRKHASAA